MGGMHPEDPGNGTWFSSFSVVNGCPTGTQAGAADFPPTADFPRESRNACLWEGTIWGKLPNVFDISLFF